MDYNKRYTVKRDFLGFKKDDIVRITIDMDNRIYFESKRILEELFYGNEKGRWGKDNPYPIGSKVPTYIFKPYITYVSVMVIQTPQSPFDKSNYPNDATIHSIAKRMYGNMVDMTVDNSIKELTELGVF